MSKEPDVCFIFDVENDVLRLPANKGILAATSPAFDAMFNGDLKEHGDVKIVDVSPAAFKEFLQLMHGKKARLTLNNIAEVLKLVDKYDAVNCLFTCINFSKKNLTIDNIVRGLHLAIK